MQTKDKTMHEFRVGKSAIQLNNWQTTIVGFFALSGLGFFAAAFMILVDIIRWSLQS